MGRRVGLVLAGLGTCLIVFAVLMPTWVSSRVLKFPLNEYASVVLTGSNASYFSPAKLTELTGVNMEATYTIKGNAAAGSSSTAVWNQFIYVYDQTNKLPFQTMTRTFAFNRRTAQLVDCCGANVNGNSSVRQTGYVGYVLPIGTQQQTYDVFDASLNKPEPFTFAGTAIVNGIYAYRFTENVSPTQNGSQTLPGALVGQSAASVTLPQFYENHVTYWIDPDTGALLNVTQNERLTLRDSSGATALVLFDAYLVATPASVNGLVALDNSQRSKMFAVTKLLPLVTGILGVILLIVGILLARRPHEDARPAPALARLNSPPPSPRTPNAPPPRHPWSPAWRTNPAKPPSSRPLPRKKRPRPELPRPELPRPKLPSPRPPSLWAPSPRPASPMAPSPRLPGPERPGPRPRRARGGSTGGRGPEGQKRPKCPPRRLEPKPPSQPRPRTPQRRHPPPRCRRPAPTLPKPKPKPTLRPKPPLRHPGVAAEAPTAASCLRRMIANSRRRTSSRFQVRNSRSTGTRTRSRVHPGRYRGTASITTAS